VGTLSLSGTVTPTNATNRTITWSVKNAGTTGATIKGNTLTTTGGGTVTVTATIANGKAPGTPYTQDFPITITFVAVNGITGVPTTAFVGTFDLSGTVTPSNATNKTIAWSIKLSGTTGATISGNTLTTTTAGTVTITGTIANGIALGTPYTQDFSITISTYTGSDSGSIDGFQWVRNNIGVTIKAYNGPGGAVVIPSVIDGKQVTSIGESAFSGCTSLTSIAIPNSVTSIETNAFYHCDSLTSVIIGNSVKSIGSFAFMYCKNLTSATIESGSISYGAFANCTKLANVIMGDGVTRIESIPNIPGQNYGAFIGCTSLTSVTIGNNVTSIGHSAFFGCTSLASVIIPNSVKNIEDLAFGGCINLSSVNIGDGVTSIGSRAFDGCSLASVIIPNNVTSIGARTFVDCTSLTSVTIGTGVTNIGEMAFVGCTSLTEVVFLGTLTETGFHGYAFGTADDLRNKYLGYGGGVGRYTKPNGTSTTWTKQY